MYHTFSVGQVISSHFGVATILSHTAGLTWGYEVRRHSDGKLAFLSADDMNPLRQNLLPGDVIGARDHNGVEHTGLVTCVTGDLKARFACGEYSVSLERIVWAVESSDSLMAVA
jgi:hypothetical protein